MTDLIVKALNSEGVKASIDRTLLGDPNDDYRYLIEDKNYYDLLELMYSRKFRKYWFNGI